MKKLTKMLLIHWYGYSRELIEFGNINFLTGKTAAGKSTIIDALQLVLLGDTNGNFFNKAANEKSVRTLKSYLFGENGDDGDTGFRYLRKGPFTSYVVLEFEDTEKKQNFLTGFVSDCYEDQNFDCKWFTADHMAMPDSLFTDGRTNTPYSIRQLRSWLKSAAKKNYEIIETNKRYQEVVLAKYGAVKRKYLTLLKKAVPFSPITDIEKFITESICDVKNNIQIEQMQSDIREYKNLEADAERTRSRIEGLTEIDRLTKVCEADRERFREQGYVILRADLEENRKEEASVREELRRKKEAFDELEEKMAGLEAELETLREELEKKEDEYRTSDLYRRQQTLEEQMEKARAGIGALSGRIREALDKARRYGGEWSRQLQVIAETGISLTDEECSVAGELKDLSEEGLESFDFPEASRRMEALKNAVSQYAYALKQRAAQLKEGIAGLETRVENLEKGIKPYPPQVTALKRKLESALFEKEHRQVEVNIFADLLEIRDQEWRNAIEGYLDRQKFNLLLPEEYYREANIIYNGLKKEENVYDTGLVDIGKLRREFHRKPEKNSLAEEVTTENEDARLYADYLLGSVIKCGDAGDLNRYPTAITKNVMLYKSYVSRRLNPARYANPFIGRRSMQILLENCRRELAEQKREYALAANSHRLVQQAASCGIMSTFEAESHRAAVEDGRRIPELTAALKKLQAEYDSLDFTYLTRLSGEIGSLKARQKALERESLSVRDERTRLDEQQRQLRERDLPAAGERVRGAEERISREYEADWVKTSGEARYARAVRENERAAMSLKESFQRARNQTATQMENHLRERRLRRNEYNTAYRMPYDPEREDNREYDAELKNLSEIRLPEYLGKIRDSKEKAYNQFRDDFIAKLKSNIESVKEQINELNASLKNSVFGTDSYHFEVSPRAEYRSYYDMITDPMLMDTGGWNIASEQFNAKYQREIDSLFNALIINETDVSAERRAEYEKNIRKFTDYKTYLVFDLIVTNDQGEKQRLSRTLLKKSGGETQIPFYIALLASFSQVCRVRSKGKNNTIRVIILDEAFSKMDGERIRESIALLRRFGLQAIFSAPPEKIPDIAPNVDRNIAVYKSGHTSFTRAFDPAAIGEDGEEWQ